MTNPTDLIWKTFPFSKGIRVRFTGEQGYMETGKGLERCYEIEALEGYKKGDTWNVTIDAYGFEATDPKVIRAQAPGWN